MTLTQADIESRARKWGVFVSIALDTQQEPLYNTYTWSVKTPEH